LLKATKRRFALPQAVKCNTFTQYSNGLFALCVLGILGTQARTRAGACFFSFFIGRINLQYVF